MGTRQRPSSQGVLQGAQGARAIANNSRRGGDWSSQVVVVMSASLVSVKQPLVFSLASALRWGGRCVYLGASKCLATPRTADKSGHPRRKIPWYYSLPAKDMTTLKYSSRQAHESGFCSVVSNIQVGVHTVTAYEGQTSVHKPSFVFAMDSRAMQCVRHNFAETNGAFTWDTSVLISKCFPGYPGYSKVHFHVNRWNGRVHGSDMPK